MCCGEKTPRVCLDKRLLERLGIWLRDAVNYLSRNAAWTEMGIHEERYWICGMLQVGRGWLELLGNKHVLSLKKREERLKQWLRGQGAFQGLRDWGCHCCGGRGQGRCWGRLRDWDCPEGPNGQSHEEYFQALKSNGICHAGFQTWLVPVIFVPLQMSFFWNGNVCPMLSSPLNFGKR